MHEDIIRRAGEIVAKKAGGGNEGYCVLALMDSDGSPTASAISVSRAEGIRRMTFCAGLGSNKARRIAGCGRASVCFAANDHNITLVGSIEIQTDPQVKREMWYPGLEQHFSGPDDPNYGVLRFTTERYNLLVDWQEAQGAL